MQHEEVPEAVWLKRLEVIQNKLPAFVEILNELEVLEPGLELAGRKVSAYRPVSNPLLYFEVRSNLMQLTPECLQWCISSRVSFYVALCINYS